MIHSVLQDKLLLRCKLLKGLFFYSNSTVGSVVLLKQLSNTLRVNIPPCATVGVTELGARVKNNRRPTKHVSHSPSLLLVETRIERRHAVLDDEGAQPNRQEPHVLDRLIAHQPPQQQLEYDGQRALEVLLVQLKKQQRISCDSSSTAE